MDKWVKHQLEYDKIKFYLEQTLESVNALSNILLTIDLKQGHFFTFLPAQMNLREILNLESGLSCYAINIENNIQFIPDRIEPVEFILSKTSLNSSLNCIFDAVNHSPQDGYFQKNPDNYLVHFQDEVYYFLRNHQISSPLVARYLHNSKAFWHSICVLTEANLESSQIELSLDFLEQVGLKTKIILIGAYDGESYIYWEKKI